MKFLLLGFCVLFISSETFAGDFDADQIKKIRMSIEKSDTKSVVDILRAAKSPFKCEKKGLGKLFGSNPSQYCPREKTGQDLLKMAFKSKPCRDEIAVELLSSGARYSLGDRYSTETMMKEAYESVCPKTINYLIKIGPDDEVANAAAKYFSYVEMKTKSYIDGLKEGYSSGGDDVEALKPISNSLRDFVMAKCPDTSKASAACTARESYEASKVNTENAIKAAEKYAAQLQAETEFEKSPSGIKKAICEVEQQIAEAQDEIDREKEIGKVSGTVNLVTLNKAGSKIVDLRALRKKLENSYKSQSGKNLPPAPCKD